MPSNNSETAPLISESGNRPDYRARPLLKLQIVPLLLAYFAETVVTTLAYPFLAQLIGDLDVVRGDKDRVGYYMGTLDSIGHLTTAIVVLQWGYYSDYAGRKKVLLASSLGLAVAITCFGLSKTFLSLALSKFLEGVFRAGKPTIKSAAAESCDGDESKMAFFFSLMPIVYAAGAAVGPFFGGVLAKPSERFPSYFGAQLWLEHPYLLSCLVAAFICIISFGFTLVLFKETLQSLRSFKTHDCQSYNAINDASSSVSSLPIPPGPTNDILQTESLLPTEANTKTRRLISVLVNYGIFSLLAISFNTVFALFLGSPISSGGLSLSPRTIGTIFSLASVVQGLFQALFFTRIHRRWGLRNVYMVAIMAYIPIYAAMPIMAAVARKSGGVNPLVWTILGLEMAACVLSPAAFSCMYIYITKASPYPSALGRTHAAAQTIYSLMGALGPASATALVAASVEYNLLGGTLAYVVLVALGMMGVGLAWLLPDDERRLAD